MSGPATPADTVVIGTQKYRLAQYLPEYGIPPRRRKFESLFSDQTTVPGSPDIERLRKEDLRWLMTEFSGGEGQKVFHRIAQASALGADEFRAIRYYASVGIDLSYPSQLRLAKALLPNANTGAALTTVEASTFAVLAGAPVVVGSDMDLISNNDEIETTWAPGVGLFRVNWYAFMGTPPTVEGNTLVQHGNGSFTIVGTNLQMVWTAETIWGDSASQNPNAGTYEVRLYIKGLRPAGGAPFKGTANVRIAVINDSNTTVASTDLTLDSAAGDFDNFRTVSVTYTKQVGVTYTYRARLLSVSSVTAGVGVEVDKIEARPKQVQNLKWTLRNNTDSVNVATGQVDVSSTEVSSVVASTVFAGVAGKTYGIRFKAASPLGRIMVADKIDRSAVGLAQPWMLDLGQGGRHWLFDYSAAAAPTAFYYDNANSKWQSLIALGAPVAAKVIATDASDTYQYALCDDKKVYRIDTSPAQVQYTAAMTPTAVGLAVAANRLYLLGEDTTNGTNLYEATLDQTAGLPLALTLRDTPSAKGPTADTTIVRRMAAMSNGVVYFCNHSYRCVVHIWDAGSLTGQPFAEIADGFQGRAICHSGGVTFLAGQFPAVNASGVTVMRPAVWKIDHLSSSIAIPEKLDANLWRDTDPDTGTVQDIQAYGDSLYVLTQVNTSPKKARLWRISLGDPFGVFLQWEVTTDDSQQANDARAIAVTWQRSILAWGFGAPYVSTDSYPTAGDQYLDSSIFNYGLTEQKVFRAVDIDGVFPAGTSVEVWYQPDQSGVFSLVGVWAAPGRQFFPTTDSTVRFKNVQLRTFLRSTDPAQTPIVFAIDALTRLGAFRQSWELLLDCTDPISGNHARGDQRSGALKSQYLFDLAAVGNIVPFTDSYAKGSLKDGQSYLVTVEEADEISIRTGESVVRATLLEQV